jgi:glycosyltransferase involved in cell wall biosynthesis
MKFSIIIPVYNVEKYIEKCILSILNQSYSDYEIIVVDDGSKDRSGEICDRYAREYDNITVIHIPNGGVSNARNVALAKAKGDYIWFIDSDDYIETNALEIIKSHIEKYSNMDLLIFDATVVDEQGKELGKISSDLPCGQSIKFESCRDFVHVNTSLWNRIYRTEVIRNKQLLFEHNITIAEDLLFNYKYLLECQNVYYEKDELYYYIQRKNSAMSGAGKNKDVEKVFERLVLYYKENGKYIHYRDEIEYLAIYHYFIVTSVRMIRCGIAKEECITILKWFADNQIPLSLRNVYVRKMAPKHILIFVLLKHRAYRTIAMLFSKL